MQAPIKIGTKVWLMLAIHRDLDVESMHQLLSGRPFLGQHLFHMEIIYLFGMLIMIKIHHSLIFHHLVDGPLLGQNNMMEMSTYVICT